MLEVKEQQEKEEANKSPKIGVSYCKHGENNYSLSLAIEEGRMIDLTAYSMGSRKVTIFDFTTSEMKALGLAIVEQAIKIEMENK